MGESLMPAKKKYNEKPSRKSKTKYSCKEVELYLDKSVNKIKNEIIPKIDALDKRDREQFFLASSHIKKYDIILKNQETLKKNQSDIESAVPRLETQIEKLHDKLDSHIEEETREFVELRHRIGESVAQSAAIQRTLDNVSANGNRGLSASLTDVYEKLKDLEKLTEGARTRNEFWHAAQKMVDTNIFLKPFKSKVGAIIYLIILIVIINTILHGFGIEFDAMNLIKSIISYMKGQS
jgi:hypothetical protein